MNTVLVLLFLIALVGLAVGLIKPLTFNKVLKQHSERRFIGKSFGLLIVLLLVLIGITAPKTIQSTNTNSKSALISKPKVSKPVITYKSESTTQPIAFTTTTEQDSTLASGTTSIKTPGVNGVQTQTFSVTSSNGKETSRKLISTVVTTAPVTKVVEQGTYVAPAAPAAPTNCTNGTYVNSAGNTVCSPETSSTVPAGATAQCVDGTYSFSQSRSGTCSHHGGVAQWLN
jgi:hypothetical protein